MQLGLPPLIPACEGNTGYQPGSYYRRLGPIYCFFDPAELGFEKTTMGCTQKNLLAPRLFVRNTPGQGLIPAM